MSLRNSSEFITVLLSWVTNSTAQLGCPFRYCIVQVRIEALKSASGGVGYYNMKATSV